MPFATFGSGIFALCTIFDWVAALSLFDVNVHLHATIGDGVDWLSRGYAMASASPFIEASLQFALTDPPQLLVVGEGIYALLGFSPQDLLSGRITLRSRIHADDQDLAEELFSVHDVPRTRAFNIRVRHANGKIRCCKVEYAKTRDQASHTMLLDLLLQDAKSLRHSLGDQTMMANFRAMMENTDDFIYFKDRNHVFTGASQTLVAITDPAEHWTDLLGKTDYDVFPEAYADIYYQLEKQVFSGISVAHEIQEIQRKDGSKGWVDNRKYPIYNETGMIVGLFGVARDITENKRRDDVLAESEQRFRSIFEQVSSLSVQGYDRNRKVIFWNPASEQLYGYTCKQALGQQLEDLIIPDAMREGVIRQIGDWVAGGAAIPASELILKDAAGHSVEVYSSHVMLRNINGEPEMYCIDIDISERNRITKALQQEQQFSKSILDSLPGIFYLYTYPDCRLVLWNKQHENLLGYAAEEMSGRHVTDWHRPEAHAAVMEAVQRVMNEGQCTIEAPLVAKDGHLVYFELTGVKFEAHHRSFFMGTGTDITGRKQLEDQVRQMAFHDALTNLPNRRLLNDRLEHAMAAGKRSGFYSALIFLDLDNFKPLNDMHGHEVGDLLLIEVADRLRRCVRSMDTVARFGGDEFVVMISELETDRAKSTAKVAIIAEKIRAALSEPYLLTMEQEGKPTRVIEHCCSASIGAALFLHNETCPEGILKRADVAMYQAKEAGGNTLVIVSEPHPKETPLAKHISTNFVQLVWHASYESGNLVIDDQHRALFIRANKLITGMLAGLSVAELESLIDALIGEVIRHFNDEEAILNQIGFPGAEEHAQVHRQLIDKAIDLAARFQAGKLAIGDLLTFLAQDMIAQHLLTSDRAFFPYLKP